MEYPKRKQNRLQNFNYSSNGVYFITICTKDKENLLCDIVGGGTFDAPHISLTPIGQIVEKYILSSNKINGVSVENYVVMPNHVHLLVMLNHTHGTSKAPSPTNNTIPHLVSTLKRLVNKEVGKTIFQRSYHDHIIRDEQDYQAIWEYIQNNPAKWKLDCFYTEP